MEGDVAQLSNATETLEGVKIVVADQLNISSSLVVLTMEAGSVLFTCTVPAADEPEQIFIYQLLLSLFGNYARASNLFGPLGLILLQTPNVRLIMLIAPSAPPDAPPPPEFPPTPTMALTGSVASALTIGEQGSDSIMSFLFSMLIICIVIGVTFLLTLLSRAMGGKPLTSNKLAYMLLESANVASDTLICIAALGINTMLAALIAAVLLSSVLLTGLLNQKTLAPADLLQLSFFKRLNLPRVFETFEQQMSFTFALLITSFNFELLQLLPWRTKESSPMAPSKIWPQTIRSFCRDILQVLLQVLFILDILGRADGETYLGSAGLALVSILISIGCIVWQLAYRRLFSVKSTPKMKQEFKPSLSFWDPVAATSWRRNRSIRAARLGCLLAFLVPPLET